MTSFYGAFVIGLGVSLGAAVGLLVFAVAKTVMDAVCGRQSTAESITQTNALSLESLALRNELTVETIHSLDRIGDVLEHAVDKEKGSL